MKERKNEMGTRLQSRQGRKEKPLVQGPGCDTFEPLGAVLRLLLSLFNPLSLVTSCQSIPDLFSPLVVLLFSLPPILPPLLVVQLYLQKRPAASLSPTHLSPRAAKTIEGEPIDTCPFTDRGTRT